MLSEAGKLLKNSKQNLKKPWQQLLPLRIASQNATKGTNIISWDDFRSI